MYLVTPLFAAILAVMFVLLCLNVVRIRLREQVSLGDGGNKQLNVAVRIQANFVEYVPFTLFLMWMLESIDLSPERVFWIGVGLLLSRIFHVIGMAFPKKFMILRQIGVLISFALLVCLSVALLGYYFAP